MVRSENQYIIDLHDVQKVYRGKVHALRGVQMQVHRGEIFGLLGPNGAGKSTLVKIMMTVVRPTHAEGTILSKFIGHKPTLARVGYLPEHHRFPSYLTGRQALDFYAALAKVDRRTRTTRANELLDAVGMSKDADRRVSGYSKGMMQRVGLAQSLINDPDLIVLDEPTDGVDPLGRREIRDMILELRRRGKTIFLNSHLLSELEMVCDRVAILVQGRVVMQGTIGDLTRDSQRYEIVIEGAMPGWVDDEPHLRVITGSDGGPQTLPIALGVPSRTKIIVSGIELGPVQVLIDRLRMEDRVIHSVVPVRETLEDLFMRAVAEPEPPDDNVVNGTTKKTLSQEHEKE